MTHLKRPWCWKSLKAVGEGDDRGWDGWVALPTRWTWVWGSSGSDWQGSLACCSPWGTEESDMNKWLNWTSNFYSTICWRDCPLPHHYCLFCHKLINHMWVGMFIGSLFCYIDYYVFFNASTILFCFLLILNIVLDQGDGCLWIWSSFLRFLWLFRNFYSSIERFKIVCSNTV